MLNIVNKKSILELISNKVLFLRLLILSFSILGIAINFNLFLAPNNLVIGGMSGLAIVIKEITGLSTTTFINIGNFILIIAGFILLDYKKMINAIIGAVMFSFFVTITAPLIQSINLVIESQLLLVLLIGCIHGISSGLIYRAGFTAGGSDIIITILNKYFKISHGKGSNIINIGIIIFASLIFGISKTILAIIIIIISNLMVDIVMIGIKDSKICIIKSKKALDIENNLIHEHNMGVSEITSRGGIFKKTDPTLLVIVPFDLYYGLKKIILKIDQEAFVATHDCYAVTGGYKKRIIPF